MIHTVKGFGIANKAEIYIFLELFISAIRLVSSAYLSISIDLPIFKLVNTWNLSSVWLFFFFFDGVNENVIVHET